MLMILILGCFAWSRPSSGWSAETAITKEFVMVFDRSCIRSLAPVAGTRIEAPLVNGAPDMKRATMFGPIAANLVEGCGTYAPQGGK